MGKGAIDDRDELSLMSVGLQARDHVLSGFDRADLIISVGYDPVEYAPARWNPDGTQRIVHIDTTPAEASRAKALAESAAEANRVLRIMAVVPFTWRPPARPSCARSSRS